LNGHRPLIKRNAFLFEAVLGVGADTLMRIQLKYNMQPIIKEKNYWSDSIILEKWQCAKILF